MKVVHPGKPSPVRLWVVTHTDDKAYWLYRNERRLLPLKKLPSETFFEHCMTGFEGDEVPPAWLPEFYGDILCWSSDVYHMTATTSGAR